MGTTIKIASKSLTEALKSLKKTAPRKPSTPILAHTLFEYTAGEHYAKFTVTNLDCWQVVEVPVCNPTEAWDCGAVVSPGLLKDADVSCDISTIEVDDMGFASLNGYLVSPNPVGNTHPENFPVYGGLNTAGHGKARKVASLSWKEASEKLMWVMKAAPKQDIRYYLNGFLIESQTHPDVCNFVATDGHRLHKWEHDHCLRTGESSATESGFKLCRAIYRREAFEALKHQLRVGAKLDKAGKVGLLHFWQGEMFGSNFIKTELLSDDIRITLAVREIDGSFPGYQRVIPRTGANGLALTQGQAIDLSKSLKSVKFTGKGLSVSAAHTKWSKSNKPTIDIVHHHWDPNDKDRYLESWDDGFTVEVDDVFGEAELRLNTKYLSDAISMPSGGKVRLANNSALESVRADSGDMTAVVMPVRC